MKEGKACFAVSLSHTTEEEEHKEHVGVSHAGRGPWAGWL
jgi:hypothetical protein